MLGITEQLNLYCMQIIDTTHWSVGSLLASFSAHEKAPLCSQQYVSTATVCPRYFFTLMGSEASLMNCNRPWIPMLSVWKDRCLKMLVYQSPVWATLSDEEKKKFLIIDVTLTLYRYGLKNMIHITYLKVNRKHSPTVQLGRRLKKENHLHTKTFNTFNMFNSKEINRQIPPKQNTLKILAKLNRLNSTRKNQGAVTNTLIIIN